jgi:hypothetical protein
MGSTTTFGTGEWELDLPVTPTNDEAVGVALAWDSGTLKRVGAAWLRDTSTIQLASVEGSGQDWQSDAPHTWATGDILRVSIEYQTDTDGGGGGSIIPTTTLTVELTANEAITTAGEYIPWDQVDVDSDAPGSAWESGNPERMVAWADGWYYVTGTLEWETTATADRWIRLVHSGGKQHGHKRINIAGTNFQPSVGTSAPIYMTAGEYVRVFAGQDDGTDRNVLSGSNSRATMTLIVGDAGSGFVKGDYLSGDLYLGGEIHENQSATGRTELYAAGGAPGVITRVKIADEGVTTSTTMQDDDELIFPIGVDEIWILDAYLIVDGPTGGDIKVGVKGPSGVAGIFAVTGPGTTASTFENATANNQATAVGTAPTGLPSGTFGVGNKTVVEVHAVIRNGATAGDVVIQWAQNTSSGTTQVLTDSYLKAVKH